MTSTATTQTQTQTQATMNEERRTFIQTSFMRGGERLTPFQAKGQTAASQAEYKAFDKGVKDIKEHYLSGDYTYNMAIEALCKTMGYGRGGAARTVSLWDKQKAGKTSEAEVSK